MKVLKIFGFDQLPFIFSKVPLLNSTNIPMKTEILGLRMILTRYRKNSVLRSAVT